MQIISRADAKAKGLKRYFTGEPCCRGHVADRIVSDFSCLECKRLKAAAFQRTDARKEYMRQHMAKWRAENASNFRATLRKSYQKHAERRREEKREARALDPQKHAESLRKSYRKHKEKRSAAMREYRENNRQRMRLLGRAYKARKRSAEGKFSVADIDRLFEEQKGECAACHASIEQAYQIDHRVALSRGGSNWPSNLQLLCRFCNASKGAKDLDDWLKRRAISE